MLNDNSNRQYKILDKGIKVTEGLVCLQPGLQLTIIDGIVVSELGSKPETQPQNCYLQKLIPFTLCPFLKATKKVGKL